jgi:hypothetical protein
MGADRRNFPPHLLVNETGPALSADLDAHGHRLLNVPAPTDAADLVRKSDLDAVADHLDEIAADLQGEISQGAELEFIQVEPNTLWVLQHNLGRHPKIITVDDADDVIEGEVVFIDLNIVHVLFKPGVSGKAYVH